MELRPETKVDLITNGQAAVPAQQTFPTVVDQLFLFGASLAARSARKRSAQQRPSKKSDSTSQLGLF